jgi:uncharacterized membrane protein
LHEASDVFRLRSNATHRERLRFNLPQRLDDDKYTLTVRLGDRTGTLATQTFELDITGERHNVLIDDVIFSPAFNVQAGRALLTTVRVENFGEKDEDGVKVAIEIPELNVGDAKFIDEVDDGEEVTSEELFVRIPACAAPGTYKATITLTFNDGFDRESEDFTITVVDGGLCRQAEPAPTQPSQPTQPSTPAPVEGKTIITVADQAQQVVKGSQGTVYPLTLTNTGSNSKTYTVSVDAPWARFEISPSNVLVVDGGESKAAFIRVLANDNTAAGQNVFSVTVKSGDKTLKEILMRANVVDSQASGSVSGVSFKRGLEVGLVVLVVLIIILLLIVGFNRLKDSGDDEPGEGQTYY